jgi:hypothetical protein
MVYGKSSRVDVMNYTYEIDKESLGFTVVIEIINDKFKNWTFSLEELKLKNNQKHFLSSEYNKSYNRTKEWVMENHPELML